MLRARSCAQRGLGLGAGVAVVPMVAALRVFMDQVVCGRLVWWWCCCGLVSVVLAGP